MGQIIGLTGKAAGNSFNITSNRELLACLYLEITIKLPKINPGDNLIIVAIVKLAVSFYQVG